MNASQATKATKATETKAAREKAVADAQAAAELDAVPTVEVAPEVELKAAQIGERILPLIRQAFKLEKASGSATLAVAREELNLMRLFDTPEGPIWNRKKMPAMYGIFQDSFYTKAVSIPSDTDLVRAVERAEGLKTLGRLRGNVANALGGGGNAGKGLVQQAIVEYCEGRMDPAYTVAEITARRPVDPAGLYWNHTTLPTRLVKAIHAEYQRQELGIPVNLGGTKSGGNGSNPTGPSTVTVTQTLDYVAEGIRTKAGVEGGSAMEPIAEALLVAVSAFAQRYVQLTDAGRKVEGSERIAKSFELIAYAADLIERTAAGTATAAHRAEAATKLGITVVGTEPAPVTDGVTTGAEQPTT